MTREETLQVMALLKAVYPAYYRDMTRKDADAVVNVWSDMFTDEPVQLVAAAVKRLIASDTKGFPPVIGQVKEQIYRLTHKIEMTEQEAWALVSKAISNSSYNSVREFEAMPAQLQAICGDYRQLYEWSQMDADQVHTVVSSNFMRSYRAKAAEVREYAKLPVDIKRIAQQLAEGLSDRPKEITEKAGM